jgi:hypothetical protein
MSHRYQSSSSDSSSSSDDEAPPPPRVRKAQAPSPEPEKPEKKTKAQKMIDEIKSKPIPEDGKKYQRLAAEKRQAVIALKEKGIEDPEYRATKSAAGRWTVKKRKFPIDQSPDLDRTAGAPGGAAPIGAPTPAPKQAAKVLEASPAPIAPQKKDSLDLNWINMQATVNDSLKRDLESLSEKYERLAQKEEKRKRLKAKMARAVTPDVRAQMPVRPAPMQPPPQQQQRPPPQAAAAVPRPGLYHRASKLSISQF